MSEIKEKNKPFNLNNNNKNNENDDDTWATFIEIISSVIMVGIFILCIYILKELFVIASDLFFVMQMHNTDIMLLQFIPFLIIVILAIIALWVITH